MDADLWQQQYHSISGPASVLARLPDADPTLAMVNSTAEDATHGEYLGLQEGALSQTMALNRLYEGHLQSSLTALLATLMGSETAACSQKGPAGPHFKARQACLDSCLTAERRGAAPGALRRCPWARLQLQGAPNDTQLRARP